MDIRRYIDSCLFATLTIKPSFVFLSKNGGRIDRSQEPSILAWNEVIEHQWTHHTFHSVITRYHLFITLFTDDITVLLFTNLFILIDDKFKEKTC